MGELKRGILLVSLFIFLGINFSLIVFSEVSKESFFSVGSEYLVMTPYTTLSSYQLQIFVLYDNTNLFMDINNDGASDYELNFNKGGSFNLSTPWQISEGSRIISDKPIYFSQTLMYSNNEYIVPDYMTLSKNFVSVPVENYRYEYYTLSGAYRFLSKENGVIFIDENIDGVVDKNYTINSKNNSYFKISNYSRVFSNVSFFGYSNDSLTAPFGKEFISSFDNITLIIAENNTRIDVDMNMDLVIDNTSFLNKGVYNFSFLTGARIIGDKNFSCFENHYKNLYFNVNYYFPCRRTKEITNEFYLHSQKFNQSLVGLFNNFSYPLSDYNATLTALDGQVEVINNMTSNILKNVTSGKFYSVISNTPLIDSLNKNDYVQLSGFKNYSVNFGSLISYKKPYIIIRPKTKVLTPNSSAVISVRIINPFSDTSLENVKVTLPLNCGFLMQSSIVNYKKERLSGGVISSTSSGVVTSVNDVVYFDYPGIIESESFVDIDYVFLTPASSLVCSLGKVGLSYDANTWDFG